MLLLDQPLARAQTANAAVTSGFNAADLVARFEQAFAAPENTGAGGNVADSGAAWSRRNGPATRTESAVSAWAEGYGLHIKNAERNGVAGDTRRSFGGVAGLRMTIAPGAFLGVSVDQSHTRVDAPDVQEQARFDLTQIGISGTIEQGPWTLSAAALRGLADIATSRDTAAGPSVAAYGAHQWGAVGALSYYWAQGDARIVPKVGADWVRTTSDAYSEVGGIDPIASPRSVVNRARIFAGAEVGVTSYGENTIFDLSAYARAIDTVRLSSTDVQITFLNGLSPPQLLPGPNEARFGIDAGATAWLLITQTVRLYAAYDGRFRSGFESHGGSIGLDLRW